MNFVIFLILDVKVALAQQDVEIVQMDIILMNEIHAKYALTSLRIAFYVLKTEVIVYHVREGIFRLIRFV